MTGASPVQRVTLVLGTVAGGTGAHVKMLATGLAERGVGVWVAGPSSADARFSFSALPTVSFSAMEISDRPRAGDLGRILRLRRLLLGGGRSGQHGTPPGQEHAAHAHGLRAGTLGGTRDTPPDVAGVVHAHGVRAGALTVLALLLAPRERRPGVVVTVHNAPPAGGGAAGLVYRLLEWVVARGADLVLCVSPDLERRMRAAGARRVERAVIATSDAPIAPPRAAAGLPDASDTTAANDLGLNPPVGQPAGDVAGTTAAAELGLNPAVGPLAGDAAAGMGTALTPVVLAIGRLASQKGFGVLLEAAAAWQDLDPLPLLVIVGDGPLAGELRARAEELGVDALFLGHRDDVPALLAAAAVFVLPSWWEGQPLVLQEALRAGTPIVATRVGGIPILTGPDTALLVPPGDPRALAGAVRVVLTDAPLAAALRVAAVARAAALPSAADAVTAALDAYAAVARGTNLR